VPNDATEHGRISEEGGILVSRSTEVNSKTGCCRTVLLSAPRQPRAAIPMEATLCALCLAISSVKSTWFSKISLRGVFRFDPNVGLRLMPDGPSAVGIKG